MKYVKNKYIKLLLLVIFVFSALGYEISVLEAAAPVTVAKKSSAEKERTFKPEHGIPVMYIDIDESKGKIADMNSSPDHTAECYGSISIKVPEGYKCEYSDLEGKDLEVNDLKLEYIRGRGTSTWIFPDKKPYKFKLDKSTDLMGMGKNKHWVLLANAMDGTFLRNKITYWLGEEAGMDYVMESVPVEVVMNDEYVGLYYLTEHVRVGKTRVDIDELKEKDSDGEALTGGYFLAMDNYNNEESDVDYMTARQLRFSFQTPDFLEYSNDNQKNYICNYLQDTENALFGAGFMNDQGVSYKDYMDINSAADYFWVQEITRNQDSYNTTSTYLYKKRNGKLYWGPIWDYDVTTYGSITENYSDVEGYGPTISWFDRMKKDEEFVSLLKNRWTVFDEKIDELLKQGGQLDKYYDEIKTAEAYDVKKWGYSGECENYDSEIDRLRTWLGMRRDWINDNLDKVNVIVPDFDNQWVDGYWYIDHEPSKYEPVGAWKKNNTGWWYEDTSGWYPKSQWQNIDFTFYYFDENGYMVTDEWINGYYISKSGAYQYTSMGQWKSDSAGWWYEDTSGWYPKNQWQKIDGTWYWFNADGYWEQ